MISRVISRSSSCELAPVESVVVHVNDRLLLLLLKLALLLAMECERGNVVEAELVVKVNAWT
jgi:hypothetical protein